jgi:hypothetical protein
MFLLKIEVEAGLWWLTPVILATWETDLGRIAVQSPSGQIVRDPISKITRAKCVAQAVFCLL